MATPKITIEVTNILQGGVTCKNPSISAYLVNGLVMPCPIVGGKIELQTDGLETGYCFDLIIDCEDCNACPPIQKRICLCDSNADCSACESCVDGICVSNCADGEFCNNGICKGCLVDGDCECNKECIDGNCECPPDLPYEYNGCCYQCQEGTTNESCQICLGGHFVAKDCGENWMLNPETCACQQCLDSGDCDAPNTCCVNGKCDCCPGYYFDPSSGGCLPTPDCSNTNDCPPCFNCVNGICLPTSCPVGYVRTAIPGSCCTKVCDCNNPSCPEGYTCSAYDESTCYCKPCSDTCLHNYDCAEGCGCFSGHCKPKNIGCEGPCYTGLDCGEGCGCLDNKCVDCKTLDCNNNADCLLALGCHCHDGNCNGSPCNDPCAYGDECYGDCGCLDGECTPCGNYPCISSQDCPEGCLCNGGICGKSDCDYVYCQNPGDCGEGCGCDKGKCVPCSTLDCSSGKCSETPGCDCLGGDCYSVPPTECKDKLKITKIDNQCKLQGQLDTKDCCSCPNISLDMSAIFVGTSVTVTGKLRKGTLETDPLLSATGISNELPYSGSVKFIVRQDEIEVDGNGAPTGTTRSTYQNWIAAYSNVDIKSHIFTVTAVGDTYIETGHKWKVVKLCALIEHVSLFEFPSGCNYKVINKLVKCYVSGVDVDIHYMNNFEKVNKCKHPIFTWYEGSTLNPLTQIKKSYGLSNGLNSYIDYLTCDDGLESCKYYKLNVDCGCDSSTLYNCNGDDTIANKLTFCSPSDLQITSNDNCNSDIVIEEVEVCCAMCSASYSLYINGLFYGSYSPSEDCILFAGGLNIVESYAIKEVKLKFPCDECDECTIKKTLDVTIDKCSCALGVMSLSVDTTNACSTGIDYTITNGQPNYAVSIRDSATVIYSGMQSSSGTFTYNSSLPNGSYLLEVTDAYGCSKSKGFLVDACCQVNVSDLEYDCATKTISGSVNDANSSGLFLVEVGSISTPIYHSFTVASGAFTEIHDIQNGVYPIKVTDSINGSCYWNGNLFVGCAGISADITAKCNDIDPTISEFLYNNETGTSLPAMKYFYVGSPVSMDVNGCPSNPAQLYHQSTSSSIGLNDTAWNSNTQVAVKIVDSIGKTKCLGPLNMLNCSGNGYSLSTRSNCNGSQKQICIKVTKTGTYSVTIGPDAPFNYTFTANAEVCFDTSLADGTYNVSTTSTSGVTITKSVVLTGCSNFVATYDCTSGLTILRDGSPWTGKIRVDGSPVSYWNYTGPNNVFLADTTPNHVLTIHDNTGTILSTITLSNINCCEITAANYSGICDPITHTGHIEFDILDSINPTGAHTILISDELGVAVEYVTGYVGSHYISEPLVNGVYSIKVYDETYHKPNIGIGSGLDCFATFYVTVNCDGGCVIQNVESLYKGEINCNNNTQAHTWRIKAINNETFALDYKIYRKPNTTVGNCPYPDENCYTLGYTLLSQGTLLAGNTACTVTSSLSDNTACFMVVFTKPGDPSCKHCINATFEQ